MGFEATLSYNLPRIDTLSHGGLVKINSHIYPKKDSQTKT